jgi:hypothetical protein
LLEHRRLTNHMVAHARAEEVLTHRLFFAGLPGRLADRTASVDVR